MATTTAPASARAESRDALALGKLIVAREIDEEVHGLAHEAVSLASDRGLDAEECCLGTEQPLWRGVDAGASTTYGAIWSANLAATPLARILSGVALGPKRVGLPPSAGVPACSPRALRRSGQGRRRGGVGLRRGAVGEGRSLLTTETRTQAADEAGRRRFRLHWRLVGPFAALTRRLARRDPGRSREESDDPEALAMTDVHKRELGGESEETRGKGVRRRAVIAPATEQGPVVLPVDDPEDE